MWARMLGEIKLEAQILLSSHIVNGIYTETEKEDKEPSGRF